MRSSSSARRSRWTPASTSCARSSRSCRNSRRERRCVSRWRASRRRDSTVSASSWSRAASASLSCRSALRSARRPLISSRRPASRRISSSSRALSWIFSACWPRSRARRPSCCRRLESMWLSSLRRVVAFSIAWIVRLFQSSMAAARRSRSWPAASDFCDSARMTSAWRWMDWRMDSRSHAALSTSSRAWRSFPPSDQIARVARSVSSWNSRMRSVLCATARSAASVFERTS